MPLAGVVANPVARVRNLAGKAALPHRVYGRSLMVTAIIFIPAQGRRFPGSRRHRGFGNGSVPGLRRIVRKRPSIPPPITMVPPSTTNSVPVM
jgi:hypothetical protein